MLRKSHLVHIKSQVIITANMAISYSIRVHGHVEANTALNDMEKTTYF